MMTASAGGQERSAMFLLSDSRNYLKNKLDVRVEASRPPHPFILASTMLYNP